MRLYTAISLIAALALTGDAFGQQAGVLSLEAAYENSIANSPRYGDVELQKSISALRQANLSTRYRPVLGVNSQAIYHSEVAEIPIEVPGQSSPSVANDQYKVAATAEQLLYDGGLTSRQKSLETARLSYERQTIAVDLYRIRSRVEDAFFSALIAEARMQSIEVRATDLRAKLAEVEALVDEGVLTGSNADNLRAELIQVEQERARVESVALASRESLGALMGADLSGIELQIPDSDDSVLIAEIGRRPELRQFELAREVLNRQDELGRNVPKAVYFVLWRSRIRPSAGSESL